MAIILLFGTIEGSVPVEQEAPAYKRSCYVSTGVSFDGYQEETKACHFREVSFIFLASKVDANYHYGTGQCKAQKKIIRSV